MRQKTINCKLKEIGNTLLKKEYKDGWSEENPTYGYCYIVSEMLYHYIYKNSTPYYLKLNGVTHWFLKNENKIIDLTGNQFNFKIDYSKAKKAAFFQGSFETDRGKISKRGYNLAKKFGIVDKEGEKNQ